MARPANQTPVAPEIQQRGLAALMLGLLSVLGITLIGNLSRAVYVLAMTLLFGLVATWLGVTALSRSRRGGSRRPRGALGGIILGAIGLGISGLMLIAFGALGPQLNQYSKCLSGANTVTAQQSCRTQFQNSVGGIIGGLNNRLVVSGGLGPRVDVDPVSVRVITLVGNVRPLLVNHAQRDVHRRLAIAEDQPVRAARDDG